MSGINKPAALANSEFWAITGGSGNVTQPSDAFIQAGWPDSTTPPARQYFNWILQYNNQGVRYLLTQGLPAWDSQESYQVGAVIIGSDNVIRMALTANSNQNPTSSGDWGSPLVPTATGGDSTTKAASTAFVTGAVTTGDAATLASAETYAAGQASTAQSNAETYAAAQASAALSNAEVYANNVSNQAQENAESYTNAQLLALVTQAIGHVTAGTGQGTVGTGGGVIASNIPVIAGALYDVECVGQIITGATSGVIGSNFSGNGGSITPSGVQVQIGVTSANSTQIAYANCASMSASNILAGEVSGAVTLKGAFYADGGCTSVNFNMFTTAGSMTVENMVVKLTRVQ